MFSFIRGVVHSTAVYCISHLFFSKPQGKFIRIHFGTSGKLSSADIETCEYLKVYFIQFKNLATFAKCESEKLLFFRSAGKVQGNIPASSREKLPHFLPDHVKQKT